MPRCGEETAIGLSDTDQRCQPAGPVCRGGAGRARRSVGYGMVNHDSKKRQQNLKVQFLMC